MNRKRIFALAFAVLMVLALAACGTKNNDKMGDMSGNGSAMTGEKRRGGARPAQGAAGTGERDPVGEYRAVGKGLYRG
jgi:hypothetical protein